PPETADDVIRRLVEEHVDRVDRVTVVTADLEVARHARAMGADISISDLFLASVIPARPGEGEKPTTLTRTELQEWAELFRRRRAARDEPAPEDEARHCGTACRGYELASRRRSPARACSCCSWGAGGARSTRPRRAHRCPRDRFEWDSPAYRRDPI